MSGKGHKALCDVGLGAELLPVGFVAGIGIRRSVAEAEASP